ncbi:MAG: hypothetical protein CO077_01885 [Candidatus Nealsonbacteria bacterium CG_4_9_14_0_8_um_filter_35_12]|uniref:Aminoglycoside phosphotransferase domain-containing protein n=2 Tax=Candidatus Nealsoniibacteriota TaxID=1817911 RepID=A0A2M8DMR5_9BACT|nr:MAG: hypothetical protein CO077_01885 [Candidatus Nealsonbacteria bacterium CG_4_9_14_0_8_um_filter_35_12]
MKMAKKIEKILDKDYIQKIFQKKADFYFPRLKSKKISDIEIERVSPVWAKKTCLARYKISFSNSSKKIIRASAKIDGSKKGTFKIMKYLYESGFDRGKFQIRKPLDYIDEVGALFYEEAKGLPLSLILERRKFSFKIFENVAELLFKIHSLNGKIKRKAIIVDLTHYKKIFRKIKKLMPSISNYVIAKKEIEFLNELKNEQGFIHGDFYPGNILINKNRIIAIDFDQAGRGPKLLDAAAFYASLEFPKSLWPLNFSQKERKLAQEIFLRKYCQLNDFDFSKTKEKLNKFLIKIFLDAIYFSGILLFDGWKEMDVRTKMDFSNKIKDLFLKVREYLPYVKKY